MSVRPSVSLSVRSIDSSSGAGGFAAEVGRWPATGMNDASKTATNQNGHMIMVIGEHVNKYLFLDKLGIIKSRTETMPEVDFKRNALH